MTTAQEQADKAAQELVTAVAQMAVPGDSEIVILLRGSLMGSPGDGSDIFYSWEWFCRPEERAPETGVHGHGDKGED